MKFIWNVTWDNPTDGSIDSNAAADLNEIRQYLESFPDFQPSIKPVRNFVVIGPSYKFTLKVRNFLGEESEEVSFVVRREDETLPGLSLGSEKKTMKTALGTTLEGKRHEHACNLEYHHGLPPFSFDIK